MLWSNESRNRGIARSQTSRRRRSARPRGNLTRLGGFERLEDRMLLSFNVTISNTPSSNVTPSGASTVTFTPTANNATINAATIQNVLNAGNSVIVNTAPGSGAQAGDITVAGSILKSAGGAATLTLRAENTITVSGGSDVTATSSLLNVTLNADRDASGDGAIALGSGSVVTSNGGAIVLGGGADPLTVAAQGTASQAIGISLNGAQLISGAGAISLRGRGQDDALSVLQSGIGVAGGSVVQSTTGGITLTGTGGAGTDLNSGVNLAGATITSVAGAIQITGTGGAATGANNWGVSLTDGAQVSSTGVSAAAATITITGTRGAGTSANYGVLVEDATVTSVAGAIQVSTAGGGAVTDGNNIGVYVVSGGQVSSTGTGANAAPITLTGTGGAGSFSNLGVTVEGTNSRVTSVAGAIQITGTGGAGTDLGNYGVSVTGGGQVASTGTGADAAPITLDGTAGAGASVNLGVVLDGAGTLVTSVDGAVAVTGQGRGAGADNHGVFVFNAAAIETIGGAALTVAGTASTTGGASGRGVFLLNAGTVRATAAGNATINGTGSGGAADIEWDSLTIAKTGGTYTLNDTVLGTTLTANAGSYNVTLNDGGTITGAVALNNTGTVTLGNAAADSFTFGSLAGVAGASLTLNAGTLMTGNSSSTTFAGPIGGVGGLTKQGSGTFTLAGANTYTGTTTINAGTLSLSGGGAIANTGAVSLTAAGATLNLQGSETIGSLSGTTGTAVTLNANTLTTGDASSTSFAGTISGSGGGLTKQGTGTFTLAGANTYTGTTTINAGTLLVAGSTTSNTTVNTSATLGGTGTITGTVQVNGGGTLAPGTGPGILDTRSTTFSPASSFDVEINGIAVDTQYDQLNVVGTVALGGASLNGTLGAFTPSNGDSFVIINNDGTDAVTGTFTGLAEGAAVTIGGRRFLITYAGGSDGNDVVLTAQELPAVALSLGGSPLAEAGGVATVIATLSAVSGLDVAVTLGFTGTATNLDDYTRSGTIITIPAGSTTGSVTITDVNDTLDEAAETVIVDITGATNGTEDGVQQVTATITDDDAPPTVSLSLADSPLAEAGGAATVTATLSTVSGLDVTVTLGFTGTAANLDDYTRSGTVITIPAGSTTGSVTITGVNDTLDEADETVVVDITDVINGTEDGVQQVTAIVDDTPPTVSLGLAGSPLAEAGGAATVTATLSAVAGRDVTVTLGFGGTATNLDDYTRSGTSITIPAGSTTGSVTITGVDDARDEANETVIVDITGVTNGTEDGVQQVTATITDDDLPPTARFTVGSQDGSEGAGTLTATVQLSAASSLDVTVPFAVGGSASNGDDYAVTPSPIVIPAGATSGTITITLVDDTQDEAHETVVLTLGTPTNATLSDLGVHTVTILDNDPPTVRNDFYTASEDVPLVVAAPGVLSNDSGTATGQAYTAVLVSGPEHGAVTLNPDGSFRYTPAADYNGPDHFIYRAGDGTLRSDGARVDLVVMAVNDAPGFTRGPDQAALEGAGAQRLVGWTTGISAGPPDEAGQALAFLASTDNPGLFAVGPAITPDGALTFTPAPNAGGAATVTVRLRDVGGTANGGADTSAPQTFTITITTRSVELSSLTLAPGSDSGLSATDGITHDNTPTLTGRATPGTLVQFFAEPPGQGAPVLIGQATADAAGIVVVTSGPLADGTYAITARATPPGGQAGPAVSAGTLVVDTVGPRVSGVRLVPGIGQIHVSFQDERSGLDLAGLLNRAAYAVRRRGARGGDGRRAGDRREVADRRAAGGAHRLQGPARAACPVRAAGLGGRDHRRGGQRAGRRIHPAGVPGGRRATGRRLPRPPRLQPPAGVRAAAAVLPEGSAGLESIRYAPTGRDHAPAGLGKGLLGQPFTRDGELPQPEFPFRKGRGG